jgi:extracellular elastinolytic metalloproteinase
VIFNENDIVGEYAFSDPVLGIRTAPYTNYPRTYGDVAGTEVHFDGEVYGAIGWKMFQNFQGAGISKDVLLDHIVDGMNFTPAQPSFEEMRDGILQSIANSGSSDACLVWDAFAHYGVGVGAKGVTQGSTVIVTESFVKPPECP